jgi:hypothetical protein
MPELDPVPRGKELEDFVGALLHATGHFVEKNIEEPNVLELDIVATTYDTTGPVRRLFEVKEGSPQFSDIFKVLGWMTYLGLDRGAFVTARPPEGRDVEFFASRCEQVGMTFIVIDDHAKAQEVFAAAGFGTADRSTQDLWRYSMWVERNLLAGLRRFAARHPEMTAPKEALKYYRLVNDGVFMTRDAVERVSLLYSAFQQHPKLTASAALELDGHDYDPDPVDTQTEQMRAALFRGQHVLLQACMYLEHRARLSLLKAAVDYIAEGGHLRQNAEGTLTIDFRITELPNTFLQGLTRLQGMQHVRQYPLLWQTFLWLWGGLILDEREDDDLTGLSEQSGLPVDEVRTALGAFDWLFPSGNWIRSLQPHASYRLTAMVPWPFQGLGAFQRLVRSGHRDYPELALGGNYTTSDLAQRHNALVRLLDGDLEF